MMLMMIEMQLLQPFGRRIRLLLLLLLLRRTIVGAGVKVVLDVVVGVVVVVVAEVLLITGHYRKRPYGFTRLLFTQSASRSDSLLFQLLASFASALSGIDSTVFTRRGCNDIYIYIYDRYALGFLFCFVLCLCDGDLVGSLSSFLRCWYR